MIAAWFVVIVAAVVRSPGCCRGSRDGMGKMIDRMAHGF